MEGRRNPSAWERLGNARSLFQNRRLKKHIYIYIGCPGFRDFNFIPDRSFEQFRVNFFSAKTLVMSEM